MGVWVVTGANSGIGLELCRALTKRGHRVVAVCRKPSSELEATGARIESGIDLTEPTAIANLAEHLAGDDIDVLINNAGLLHHDSFESVDAQSIRDQLEVNAIAPLLLTQALAPKLHAGSKVALVTSRMGSMGDNTSGGAYGYRMSKAALNAAGVSLARDLASRQIAVVILHPGFVRTKMTGQNGLCDPDESARGLLERIEELTLETTGRFLHMNGDVLPW